MLISGNASEGIRFLALFYVKSYDNDSSVAWIFAAIQFLEIVLMLLSGLLNTYTVYMCVFSNSFHPNIISLYSIFMLHWFELTISRILVFPYQEGIYPVISTDSENSVIMYTFDDTVIDFGSFENHFSFLLGAGVRARYMLLVCFALPCVAVERCFATLMVRDYEQKSRSYISVSLILLAETLATIGAVSVTYRRVSVLFLATTATLLQLASYMVIHILVVEVGIMIMTASITITLATLGLVSYAHTVCVFYALEKFIHVNPLFICTAVFFIKPNWFKRLLRLIPGRLKHRTHAMDYAENSSSHHNHKHRPSQADVHFEQLKKIW